MSPIIGFSLDFETTPTYSKKPWYAIRENYLSAVAKHGAVPIALPHEPELAEQYLDLIDGLVITGGAFDVDPKLYGDTSVHETVALKPKRTQFEFAITQGAVKRKMPILGICGGEQLLNVVLGGTLIQHIPDVINDALAHEQPNPRDEPGHSVEIKPNTLLHRIVSSCSQRSEGAGSRTTGTDPARLRQQDDLLLQVNSAHHQAVGKLGPDLIINAIAPDGVIEGIELPVEKHPFCLGVQWHPEYHVTAADGKIFEAFVRACGKR